MAKLYETIVSIALLVFPEYQIFVFENEDLLVLRAFLYVIRLKVKPMVLINVRS